MVCGVDGSEGGGDVGSHEVPGMEQTSVGPVGDVSGTLTEGTERVLGRLSGSAGDVLGGAGSGEFAPAAQEQTRKKARTAVSGTRRCRAISPPDGGRAITGQAEPVTAAW